MVALRHQAHNHHRIGKIRPVMTTTTVSHHQQINAITASHVARLAAQRRLCRNGRTKSQHSLRCRKGECTNNTNQQQDDERCYEASPTTPGTF